MPFGGFVLVGLFGLLVIDREPLPSGQVEALKLAFLTEEQVEIGGEMKPAYVTYSATASMAENSTIMLSYGTECGTQYVPHSDKLLGWGAYITVVQKQGEKGAYSFVTIAAQPPKGSVCPATTEIRTVNENANILRISG